MSQVTLTNQERVDAIVRLGYTGREAAFLCLAALHGGFFLRRQYCQFIGREVGGTAATLIQKVLSKGHATAATGCYNAKVYHLSSRPFYAALGQEDNRNRRTRPPFAIRNKLMCLDFVLDHPGNRYLSTEREKVAYFTRRLGVEISDLPVKLFRSPTADDASARYFVDKYPIFVSDPSSGAPGVSFCYVDEGVITSARFETYLKQYRRLFARLEHFEVIYVAASTAPFMSAQNSFQKFLASLGRGQQNGLSDLNLPRLLDHFEQRRLYDAGQFDSFDRAKLIRLRNDRQEFTGRFFEGLYESWISGGEDAVRAALPPESSASRHSGAMFTTYLLGHNYDIFGTPPDRARNGAPRSL